MNISEFTYRLMLVGIPGIATYFLLKRLAGKIGSNTVEAVLSIFVFAILCYLTADAMFWGTSVICAKFPCLDFLPHDADFSFVRSLIAGGTIADDIVLGVSTLCSVPVAAVLSFMHRKKIWNRACQMLRCTNRFGDEDVFNYFLDSKISAPKWYVIRDHKESLVYYGAIAVWSDEGGDRELVLAQVDVYSNLGQGNAQFLYECTNLYLCRKRDDLSIELIPETQTTEADETESGKQSTAVDQGGATT